MYDFLNYLIKKSELENTDYYKYNPSSKKRNNNDKKYYYKKINEPETDNFVVFDIETTGFSHKKDRIIEIGALKINNSKVVETFSKLINPEIKIPPFIESKIKITNEMVKNKPNINKILPEFKDFIENYTLIAHNARFDMQFILCNADNQKIKITNPVLDTLELSRKYLNSEKNNLNYLCKKFNIINDNPHRAYDDAYAEYEIYKIIISKYKESIL